MEKKPEVVIGVPVSDTDAMRALTAQAIGGCIITSGSKVIDMLLRRSCDIASNRTWLVQQAIHNSATHILFVDSDMVFPHDTLNRLLAHKKDIIGVEYNKREFPLKRVCEPLTERSETEPYKAKYTGTGLLLINIDIFANLGVPTKDRPNPVPWFNFGRDKYGALTMGEDVWFCNVARDAGYDIWVDPTIKVLHIGEYAY